jgi:hypothetical protein
MLATDNTGLIARVTSQSRLRYPIPNATFKSDWDIVESIGQTVRASHIRITLEHVRGHQDDTTQADEMDLLAQLNVEADKYAGDFRFRRGEYRPIIPMMPTRSVSLDIDGKTERPSTGILRLLFETLSMEPHSSKKCKFGTIGPTAHWSSSIGRPTTDSLPKPNATVALTS